MRTAHSPSTAPSAARAARHASGLWADGAALGDGEARDALRAAMQQLTDAEGTKGSLQAPAMCQAHTETARALAGLHAYSPAESHLAQALGWAHRMGGLDLRADLHCAWAEVATNDADLAEAQDARERSRAARDRARDHAFESARLAGMVTDPNWEIRVLLRASDVLERCGDHDDAVLLQQRALELLGLGQASMPDDAAADDSSLRGAGAQTAPGALM